MKQPKKIPDFVMGNLYRMRAERKKKGILLREICQETGLARSHICKYETEITHPNPKIYNKLASVFGWKMWFDGDIGLLPCPFCGGEAVELHTYNDRERVIQCSECNARSDYHASFFEAAGAWNRRIKNE